MPDIDQDQDNKPLHGPNLVLDVENFGPIAEAKNIEFRPMTVFVGPSNTGKSYLAMLLHAMMQGMNGFRSLHSVMMNPYFVNQLSIDERRLLAIETARLATHASASTRDGLTLPVDVIEFSDVASGTLRKLAGIMIDDLFNNCVIAIEDFFESGIDVLGNSTNILSHGPSIDLSDVNRNMIFNFGNDRRSFPIQDGTLNIDIAFARLYETENHDDKLLYAIVIALADATFQMIVRSWSSVAGSVYFPAARTGILTSHKLMTDSLITNAHRVGVDAQPGIAYHKVAREFLRMINLTARDLSSRRHRDADPVNTSLESAAQRLEESVIRGRIEALDSQWGPPDFVYHPYGDRTIRLPMFRSSSMVTEVAPIVHFLRTHVRMGDLLIVEEPEAHLHPAAQQRMAAALAYMVRIGLRVLVTTHSHYIVEQLGALVNAGAEGVSPEERARHMGLLGRDIDRYLFLKQDEVAVYEFEPRDEIGSPSDVIELEFDTDAYAYYPGRYSTALVDQRNRNMHMLGARLGF